MKMGKKKIFGIIVLVIILGVGGFATSKKISPLSLMLWGEPNNSSGLAIEGYDPVAYQTEGTARPGNTDYQVSWQNVSWNFSSPQNMAMFQAAPEKFVPQYGSYCAFAVYNGVTADTDPEVWHVADNKLYLFLEESAKTDWLAADALANSDSNWSNR